ncbi:hypothetical protein KPL71_011738 [Citrus sinensis]|uniref:Uncharacterized protein n=2 Tax=Citrus sinensis TaxID=2711 RepID=A0ACB8L690_CITSI|nr:hypothetical protein KPL71_011738 [Citrus sinensis]
MEAEASFSAIAPTVFDGNNYQLWAVHMEAYLEALDLWEAVEEDYEIPALPNNPTMAQIKAHKEKKTKKSRAKACLFAAVSSTIFTRIMSLKSAKAIWDYLKSEYEGDERIKGMQVLNLIREFELQRMKDSETIKDYSDRLLSIANKVRLLGSEFTDSRIVQKILVTVPERYEATITTFENTKDLSKISLAELLNALQAPEQRRLMRGDTTTEGALAAKHQNMAKNKTKKKDFEGNGASTASANAKEKNENQKKSYPPCKHCRKKGHPPFKCWRRPDAKCTKYNQMGHEAVICKNENQHGEEAKTAGQEEEDHLFVATCFSGIESSESWLIDSGCTNHMTHNKDLFRELSNANSSKVRVGNGTYIAVKGKGTVAITTFSDADGKDIFRVKMKGKSFVLNPLEEEQNAFPIKENITELWHKRLGHYHHQGLLQMKSKGMANDLPELDDYIQNCKACQFGKQSRRPFPKATWRATKKLQLVHTDIAGPQRTPSLNGSLYYVVFIDDFTRMCWIFFLKHKSEVAQVFWNFKARVENESGCRIQTLRSDNGKEYTSGAFNRFCEEAGIQHQLTTPYTPQQNGVSERRNRFILEMTRCMLHEKNLPKQIWAEAASTAVFLQNRLPTRAVRDKTPFEAWYGYKPSLKFLRIFGCLCFTHVPQISRDKLDKRALPGIFIGYSSVAKAYKVFQPQTGKIIISKDVHFMEDEEWNWDDAKKMDSTSKKPKLKFPIMDTADQSIEDWENETVDDRPIRGTRPLSDVYQRCNVAVCEPTNYKEAKTDQNWVTAMNEELFMIEKNKTWELADRPQNRKVIGVKWVYKTKLNADGSINKYKARLVVKGFTQVPGVDYSDTFAPVARLDIIRLLLAVAAQKNWRVYQLNVKSAFLNGFLQEQPEGYVKEGEEDKVYLLKKALYGLKQAPRAWHSRIDEYLRNLGFVRSLSESTLYVKHIGADILIISLYVDDLLVTGNKKCVVEEFKQEMMEIFEMTDLGLMAFFLGMEIKQNENEVFICQKKYAREILKKFKLEECKEMSTPMNSKEKLCKEDGTEKVDQAYFRSLIGCLMYLTATRPDILNAVSILSRFMHCASEWHLKAAKRVLRYVKGTCNFGIKFTRSKEFKLFGYSDSDWGEFVAATAAVNQALWLRKILIYLNLEQEESTEILVDNQAAIAISQNPVFHGKTKHFNIKLFFLREVQKNGVVSLVYCKTEDQVADVFTKPLPVSKFEFFRTKLGVCSS